MLVQEAKIAEKVKIISLDGKGFDTPNDALTALLEKKHKVGLKAESEILKMKFQEQSGPRLIIIANLLSLDFFNNASWEEVFVRARSKKFGYKLCSNEDACYLRLELGQQKGESLFVATDPMYRARRPYFFHVRRSIHDGASWLSDFDLSTRYLCPEDTLAFRFPG